ncbi:MAG: restriction endonuclease [Candidatus Levyibacteriota bacterium]
MVHVLKASGVTEPFSEEKLKHSMKRAGIPGDIREEAVRKIKPNLYENIPTSKILKDTEDFLQTFPKSYKAKYSLKKAVMNLGPTGYPFEDFISEVLKAHGYQTKTRVTLSGKCIEHEIDIIAEKDNKRFMIEAKFHNTPGGRSNAKVSMYTKARFDDVSSKHDLDQAWVVTNTKVSTDALTYANCNNMRVMSWNYPEGESLRDLIENSGLHPITALDSLTSTQKQTLIQNNLVLCKEVARNRNLENLGLPKDKIDKVVSEAVAVCGISS